MAGHIPVVAPKYQDELPPYYHNAWNLLHSYSHIPPEQIEAHIRDVRQKAWEIHPYGCIGRWRFLDLYLTGRPEYGEIVDRIKNGAVLLDAGCCMGYTLRQLALDGAPQERLLGTDLQPDFIRLGYELFQDRDTWAGTFVTGDAFDEDNNSLQSLDGKADIIHAASFFHLFTWEQQIQLSERVTRFFRSKEEGARDRKDILLVGRQTGDFHPTTDAEERATRPKYFHNVETLQELWDIVGKRTNSKWEVTGSLGEETELYKSEELKRTVLQFSIRRL